jgi:hypothetical protein
VNDPDIISSIFGGNSISLNEKIFLKLSNPIFVSCGNPDKLRLSQSLKLWNELDGVFVISSERRSRLLIGFCIYTLETLI